MNNKIKNLITIIVLLLILVFTLNIVFKEFKLNNSNITRIKIWDYLPTNYELTLISNSNTSDIRNFISTNISKGQQKDLITIKDGISTYLGFDFQKDIKEIYDGEFAISFIENKSYKKDILFIIKIKKNKSLKDIFNIENDNYLDKIIELKRPGKLNYISHIVQTHDNYILASSNISIIDNALNLINKDKKVIIDNLNINKIDKEHLNFLVISNNILKNNSINNYEENKLITTFNFEDNTIKLRSQTFDINELPINNYNEKIINNKDIIFSNKLTKYKNSLDFLLKKIPNQDLFEELSEIINYPILFIGNDSNWVLSFSNKLSKNIDIDKLESLQDYRKETLNIEDNSYSIYTKDLIKIKSNEIKYTRENPIFIYQDNNYTGISNNFDQLLNIKQNIDLSNIYISSDLINKTSYKYLIFDRLFINNINKNQLKKYFNFLDSLNYITINDLLFSIKNTNIFISQKVPEIKKKIYLEANIEIF